MQVNKWLLLSKYKLIFAIILWMVFGSTNISHAQTAGDLLNKMNADQQSSYVAGVIEGLAYSRFLQDKPDETGMQCIYSWYHNGKVEKWKQMQQWFAKHSDKPVGLLLHVLIKKECEASID